MVSEKDILSRLMRGELSLPPLSFRLLSTEERDARDARADALIEIGWQQRSFRFAVECKSDSSPKSIRDAKSRLADAAPALNANPLLIVPWLPPEQLRQLEQEQVSGIDLNGNGVVIVPGELFVFRTGQPNAYPQSRPIRNVYRGDSSIVARVFLLRPTYGGVGEIREEIEARSSNIAFSTTSKVLKALEADLIVGRESGAIRLLQSEKLLEELARNYRQPKVQERWVGKCPLAPADLAKALAKAASGSQFVLTGASSVSRYATMAREPVVSVYCDENPRHLIDRLGLNVEQDARFPNLEILSTDDATVYFDRRAEPEGIFASPVQTWLETASGDKRQQEVAQQVKASILNGVGSTAGGRP